VAVAAAIQAERCDIYTDVDGVYTTDPRIVPKAKRLEKVAFEEMLEMASLGAKVLQVRSVELAMTHRVPTYVRSSFDDPADPKPGTLLCDEEDIVEQQIITGIAYSKDEAQITLRKVADKPGIAAAIFVPLADANINVDMIIQVVSDDTTTTDITFTVPTADYEPCQDDPRRDQEPDRICNPARCDRCGESLGDWRRHAQPCGRCGPRVQGFGRKRRQYPRDHHIRDQILGFDRQRLYGIGCSYAAFPLRAR